MLSQHSLDYNGPIKNTTKIWVTSGLKIGVLGGNLPSTLVSRVCPVQHPCELQAVAPYGLAHFDQGIIADVWGSNIKNKNKKNAFGK